MEGVKKKREEWKWENMKQARLKREEYVKLYVKKKKMGGLEGEEGEFILYFMVFIDIDLCFYYISIIYIYI